MSGYNRTYESRGKLFFLLALAAIALLLTVYMYFIYLAAYLSFSIERQNQVLIDLERGYQDAEETYVSAFAIFNTDEAFHKDGFVKISSPQFVFRRTNVAFRQ